MRSRRSRPGHLAVLLAILVSTLPAAFPGRARAAAPSPEGARPASATIVLTSQPAWVPPDSSAVLGLAPTGPADGLEVRVTAHRAVTSRSAFTRNLEGSGLGAVEGRLTSTLDLLPSDPEGNRLLTIGIQGPASATDAFRIVPGRTGVYPLELELLRDGRTMDRFVTPLVVIAPGLVPLTLAWVLRLDATPARRPSGAVRGDAARAFAPGGRLARLADAAARSTDVPLTLAPTPETLEAWATGDGRRPGPAPDSAATLAGLRAAVSQPTHEVVGGPYVPVDMPSLLSADLGTEVDRQFERGAHVLTDVLGTAPQEATILSGRLDSASVGRLRQYGVDRVVVSPSALQPVPQRLTPGRPFRLPGKGRPVTAAVTDPDLAALLSGTGPPALRAARFLAALSLIALEAPREPRGVVVVTPAGWDPPAALLDAVVDGLRDHPAVQPETLDHFFAKVGPETRDGKPVVRNLAQKAPADPSVDPATVRSTRRRLAAFTAVVGRPPAQGAEGTLLTSLADPPGDESESAFKGRSTPRAYLSAAGRFVEDVRGRVRGPDGQRVTLTARRASIPISLLNANPIPLQVRVRLESDQLRFPGGSERVLTLPPQNTTERFAVETRAPGAFPLVITVTSPDGQMVVNRSKLTIRSTVVSGVGKLLTAGAGIFLLVWWANDLRRQHRRRRLQGEQAAGRPLPVGRDATEPGEEDIHVATPAG